MHRSMSGLSVIIIAKNEEQRICRMLDSVHFADEIIVVDGGSTDATVHEAIARGAVVHVHADWNGFGAQRNRALGYATQDWVLALDCDEWITGRLREELISTIRSPRADAYRIPRVSFLCGRRVRHSGWWPDYVTRLFRRGTATFSDHIVHERLLHQGSLGTLHSPLMHETHRTIDEALSKMNRYSSDSAQGLAARHRRGGIMVGLLRAAWMFFRTYVLHRGVLDGREGFLIAIINAETTFWRYAKVPYLSPHRIVAEGPRSPHKIA
jgi:glycosyltransferase involved in cell wall biosynthesis